MSLVPFQKSNHSFNKEKEKIMAIPRLVVFPLKELTDDQRRLSDLAELAFDALLQINGCLSVALRCTNDERIRRELTMRYSRAGWNIRFVPAGDSDYYYVDISA